MRLPMKIIPSLRGAMICSIVQPPQIARTRFQSTVVIVAETGGLHQVEDLLHIVFDAMQSERSRFVDGERSARIAISGLPTDPGLQ